MRGEVGAHDRERMGNGEDAVSLFHTHQWIEHGRHFNAPRNGMVDGGRYPEHFIWKCLHGYTVILLKCASCGDQKTTEVLGDARAK
jgi:hypothetical protein